MRDYDFRPIILIGAARSGTKMLRDVIATHPAIDKVPYDVNYIWRIDNEDAPSDVLTPKQLTPQTRKKIIREIGRYHKGSTFLIEKTVSNCLRIPFISAVFPDALYIHLVRDGYDVIESTRRQWQAPTNWRYVFAKARTFPVRHAFGYGVKYTLGLLQKITQRNVKHATSIWGVRYAGITDDLEELSLLEVCAKQWFVCVEQSLAGLQSVSADNVLTVQYETFVNQPRIFLEQFAERIAVDVSMWDSIIKQNTVSKRNIGKGKLALSTREIEQIVPYVDAGQELLETKVLSGA